MTNTIIKNKISPLKLTHKIDYTDIKLLLNFMTEYGKISSRRETNLTVKQQKKLKLEIKKARRINPSFFLEKTDEKDSSFEE